MIAAALAISNFAIQAQRAPAALSYRFEIPPPSGTSYEGLFAISPDGRQLAFTTSDTTGLRSLWIRPLEGLTAQRIDSTDDALFPFWSPDAGSIGFFADRKLKIVNLATRTVRIVSDTGTGGGGTWSADGVILFADESTPTTRPSALGLRRVAASGGVATPVMPFEANGDAIHAFPHFLPDGRHYLFMKLGVSEPGVYVGRLDADEPMRILPALITPVTPDRLNINGPLRATFAAGHLFYLDNSDDALMAQAFDVGRLQLTGDRIRIAEDVENSAPGLSVYDVSASGLLAYRQMPASAGDLDKVTWFNRGALRTDGLGDFDSHKMVLGPVPVESSSPVIVQTNWRSLPQR
jgi:hypothetical protein